jgi:hypothetical protein
MHIKHIPRAIKRRVVREMYDDHPEYLGQTVFWQHMGSRWVRVACGGVWCSCTTVDGRNPAPVGNQWEL